MSDAATHYDRVTAGWRLIFGEHLHFGLFGGELQTLTAATGLFGGELQTLTTATERLCDRLAELAGVHADDRVVDVGCGTGAPAVRLAQRTGCQVVAVTNSKEGATAAIRKAADAGLTDKIQVLECDALATNLPAQSASVAWVMESSHLFAAKDHLFTELHRLLAPGGRLILCDIIDRSPAKARPQRADLATLRLMQRVFGPLRIVTLAQYRELLAASGFRVDVTEDVTDACLATMSAWRANLATHRQELAALWPAADIEAFETCSVEIEAAMRAGRIGYGVVAATR
jgi:27-O-demethylrifamycin SV methyltransferase